MLDIDFAQPGADHQEDQARQCRHSEMEAANRNESPTVLFSEEVAGPKTYPAEQYIEYKLSKPSAPNEMKQ